MRASLAIWCACSTALVALDPYAAFAADARAGEALYVGAKRLSGGGAPCLACHGLAAHGLGWAASFGPDLSAMPSSYDRAALEAVLADVPFPSMEPLYRGHAITEQERAHLASFLLQPHGTAAEIAAQARWRLALEAFAIAAPLLAALVLLARRRMPPVKDALLDVRSKGAR